MELPLQVPAVSRRCDDSDAVERVVAVTAGEDNYRLRGGRPGRRKDWDVELAVQGQPGASFDAVAPGMEIHRPPLGDHDDACLNRSVNDVRERSDETVKAGALPDVAWCDLERTGAVGKSDGMGDAVVVEPVRVHPGRDVQDGGRWSARGKRDTDGPERRPVCGKREHSQDAQDNNGRDEPPGSHHVATVRSGLEVHTRPSFRPIRTLVAPGFRARRG